MILTFSVPDKFRFWRFRFWHFQNFTKNGFWHVQCPRRESCRRHCATALNHHTSKRASKKLSVVPLCTTGLSLAKLASVFFLVLRRKAKPEEVQLASKLVCLLPSFLLLILWNMCLLSAAKLPKADSQLLAADLVHVYRVFRKKPQKIDWIELISFYFIQKIYITEISNGSYTCPFKRLELALLSGQSLNNL